MLKLPSPTSTSLETKRTSPHSNPKSTVKTTRRNPPTSPPLTSDQNQNQTPNPTSKPTPNETEPPAPPFRSVSACNRCRIRKHRCDQRLPRCESCEKAQVRCVGYDPLTKQEVPRSYVAFLESRVNYLNQVLIENGIGFKPAIAYDEEEALKMEAGQSPRFESRGLRESRERERERERDRERDRERERESERSLDMGIGIGARARKRKQYPEDSIPTRQVKRLAQLNVLLTELLTDGCEHRCCSRDPGGYGRAGARRQRGSEDKDALEQRLPWSPRSFDSVDHSDSCARSVSPVSSEPYYPRRTAGRGSSLLGVNAVGADGREVHETERQTGAEVDLVDFESGIPSTKPVEGNTDVVRHMDVPSRVSSPKEGSRPEPKFDIAADLLRGRRERERTSYDLLDEFLVDWVE